MKVPILNLNGEGAGEFEVRLPLIASKRGEQAVHETVVARMAARRRGTASTKTVGEVQGTNKKPWRQKGTGRARAGSFRSPLWRGGGVTHGPKPRDFSKKVNRQVRKLALLKALSARVFAGDVLIVEDLALSAPKTREFSQLVDRLQLNGKTSLFLIAGHNRNVELATRNLVGVHLNTGQRVDAYELLAFDKVVFTKAGFAEVEARLAEAVAKAAAETAPIETVPAETTAPSSP